MPEPTRWRKKPVVIEAWPLTPENVHDVAAWCGGTAIVDPATPGNLAGDPYVAVEIPTLEGTFHAPAYDPRARLPHGWVVIRGVKGEFYACAPDVFADTYEQVAETPIPRTCHLDPWCALPEGHDGECS